jgi:hypothetical protein
LIYKLFITVHGRVECREADAGVECSEAREEGE